jgi:uncharacterized membrane protein YkoI
MKVNRLIAMAALAVLVVAGLGLMSTRIFAQSAPPLAVQAQTTEVPAQPESTESVESSATEAANTAEDTDAQGETAGGTNEAADANNESGADEQSPSYTGSITVPESTDSQSEADEAAALAGLATISADDAGAAALAANPGTTVVKTELDNENGALVYSVELDNGLDVKVDAGNGAILHTDSGGED